VRRSETVDGRVYTLTDTVGFVRNLPHQLVEAFRSTLEEVGDADVIVHVVDGSHPDPAAQLRTVRDVIGDVGARDIPRSWSSTRPISRRRHRLVLRGSRRRRSSSHRGRGGHRRAPRPHRGLCRSRGRGACGRAYDRGDLVSAIHEHGIIVSEEHGPEGTILHAHVPAILGGRLAPFAV
jgi:GTP-binding protein HflX